MRGRPIHRNGVSLLIAINSAAQSVQKRNFPVNGNFVAKNATQEKLGGEISRHHDDGMIAENIIVSDCQIFQVLTRAISEADGGNFEKLKSFSCRIDLSCVSQAVSLKLEKFLNPSK